MRVQALLISAALATTTSLYALADGGGGDSGGGASQFAPPVDQVIVQYNEAVGAKDWNRAVVTLRGALVKNPSNADYHNLYAYSLRHISNPDMGLVFKHYGEALRLNPKHRGALEYSGEAYLQVGDLAKAKEQLGVLDKLCFLPCTEFTALKKSIAEFEARQKSQRSGPPARADRPVTWRTQPEAMGLFQPQRRNSY